MDAAAASNTALRVALRRAAHQLYDRPVVFADPLAVQILGDKYAEQLSRTPRRADRPWSVGLRAFLVARSRYAEDGLALAVNRGVRQYVLLGAGLETFAYRNPYADVCVFEVDHPATQQWKQEMLLRSGIAVPKSMCFIPVDFETQSIERQLSEAGYDRGAPAFFSWLGVVPYLTLAAFRATLGFVAGLAPGTGLVMDYGQPRFVLPLLEQLAHDSLAARVAQSGEPFQLFFIPQEMAVELTGFDAVEDVGSVEINVRYFAGRADGLEVRGQAGRFVTAWK